MDISAWSGIQTHDPSFLSMSTSQLRNRDFCSVELAISKHPDKYRGAVIEHRLCGGAFSNVMFL
jgi:hypothetical protein